MTEPDPDANFENFSTEVTGTPPSNVNSDNPTFGEIFIEHLAMTMNVYYTPVLIVLGCLGNLISIVVFFKSKLRMQSTSQYLSALAISDTIFLLQLLPPWLKAVGVSTLFTRDGYCQLFVYLSYVSCNNSSWLVVAFTVERFVAVVYPLKRNAMCTLKRSRHVICLLAALALLINLPVLRFAVPKSNDCNIDELLMSHAARFNVVDTLVAFTLPLAAIMVLNAWIMWGVYRVGRARRLLTRQQRPYRQRAPNPTRPPLEQPQHSQQRVTKMLLIVSSVFVLLNLPAYTMRIIAYAYNMREQEYSGAWAASQQVCLLFFNTNFGINFLLYCLTGQNFRKTLKNTFLCFRKPRLLMNKDSERAPRASSMSISFSNHTENTTTGNNGAGNIVQGRGGAGQATTGPSGEDRMVGSGRRSGPVRAEYVIPGRRHRREKKVIQRWRFDNSRQQRRASAIEMQQLPSGNI